MKTKNAALCIVDSIQSDDPNSPDPLRTMFRRENPNFFGDCLQIVDSQFYASLLHDRCGLEENHNVYVQASKTKLIDAAECRFRELVHQFFCNHLKSIEATIHGSDTDDNSRVAHPRKHRVIWIPRIPNTTSIDAAFLVETKYGTTLSCFQYTTMARKWNSKTLKQLLDPLCTSHHLCPDQLLMNLVFVVPRDAAATFSLCQRISSSRTGESMFQVWIAIASRIISRPSFASLDCVEQLEVSDDVMMEDKCLCATLIVNDDTNDNSPHG